MDRRVYTVKGSRRFSYIMLHSTDSVPVPVHSSCYSSGLRAVATTSRRVPGAEIRFDTILDQVTDSDPSVTDYAKNESNN